MTTTPTPSGPRVLVLGDSWIRGLSKGKGTIARMIPDAVGAATVLDLSKISRTSSDLVAEHLQEIEEFRPDFALLAVGGADALIFPAPFIQRLIDTHAPPQWQGVEGLFPKAYVPRDRKLRYRQHLETFAKTVFKQLAVLLFGAHRRVALDVMERDLRTVYDLLERLGTVCVVMGFTDADPFTHPRTTRSMRASDAVVSRLVRHYPRMLWVRSLDVIERWDDYLVDRLHLARTGHDKLATKVLSEMAAAGSPWAQFVPVAETPDAILSA